MIYYEIKRVSTERQKKINSWTLRAHIFQHYSEKIKNRNSKNEGNIENYLNGFTIFRDEDLKWNNIKSFALNQSLSNYSKLEALSALFHAIVSR